MSVWWVDATSGDDANSGTWFDDAFLTIGAADTAASDWDTIKILPGTYAEAVATTFGNPRIIIGSGVGRTTIAPASGANAVLMDAIGDEIHNLTVDVTNVTTEGLWFSRTDGRATNIEVMGAGADRLLNIQSGTRFVGEDLYLHDGVTGLYLRDADDSTFKRVRVEGNSGAGISFAIAASTDVSFLDCLSKNNAGEGINTSVNAAEPVTFLSCVSRENGASDVLGSGTKFYDGLCAGAAGVLGDDTITAAVIATGAIDADALATDAVEEIRDAIIDAVVETEGSITQQQAMSIMLSALAGVTSGMKTTFKSPNGNTTRITGTVDSTDRLSVTLTPSS